MEASPDLSLPAAVVAFDSGLEAGFAGRREDWSHLQGEADAGNTTEVIGVVMSALEPGVVVELSVTGQTELTPVFDQSGHRKPRGDSGSRPGSRQGAVKRDGVEDFHVDSAFNDKAFDDVEAIGLDLPGRQFGQVPAARRAWPAHPSVTIQSSSPFQDSANGANRRGPAVSLPNQLPVDGEVAVLSQVACLPKLLAQLQDLVFDLRNDTVSGLSRRPRGAGGPVHTIQTASFGPAHPSVHRPVAPPKAPSDRAQRITPPDGPHYPPAEPAHSRSC